MYVCMYVSMYVCMYMLYVCMYLCICTQVVVLNAFDKMIDVVRSIPRVESKLYPTEV